MTEPTLKRVRAPRIVPPPIVASPPSTEAENLALALKLIKEMKRRAEAEGSPARPYLSKFKSTRLQLVLGTALTSALGVLDGSVSAETGLLATVAVAIMYIAGKSAEHMIEIWGRISGQKPPN